MKTKILIIIFAIIIISPAIFPVFALTLPPLGISCAGKDLDEIKAELIRHINTAKAADLSRTEDGDFRGEYYQMYWTEEIFNISEFYFPAIDIDGFELYNVLVVTSGFGFNYHPADEPDKDMAYHSGDSIAIWIDRPEYFTDYDHLKSWMEQCEEQNINFLLENGLMYVPRWNTVMGQIDDICFTIRVPDNLNDFDFLRGLCLEMIDTAELVIIEDYSPKTGDFPVAALIFICVIILTVIYESCNSRIKRYNG